MLAIWPAQPAGRNVIALADLLRESQVLEALKQAGPSRPQGGWSLADTAETKRD